MSHIHKIKSGEQEYTINLGSYAIMHIYRKHGIDGLDTISVNDLNFDMIKLGLSENGSKEISDSDVYSFIDGLEGGMFGDIFKETITNWVLSAFNIPETKKKEELQEA
jgi:hypothetical protein